MKADKLDKEINKYYTHINSCRVDVYLMKTWMSGLFLGIAGVILVLLLMQMFINTPIFRTISMSVMLIGALIIFSIYFFTKMRGPLNYTEFMFQVEEKQFLAQIFNKKWIIFSDGEITVEMFKGETVVRDAVFNKDFNWDCFIGAHYTDKTEDKYGITYIGERDYAGRKVKHKVSIANGTVNFSEVDGVRMKFSDVNSKTTTFALPQKLYDFAISQGMDIPYSNKLNIIPTDKK